MIQNMRDLGGIQTEAARIVKQDCLIRSADLFQAEEEDLTGISTIIDLRTRQEAQQRPDRKFGREYFQMPIFEEETPGISHESGTEQNSIPDMKRLYQEMVKRYADSFGRVLLAIIKHDFSSGAVLWHCTEGKDRCGLTTAFILELLGIDRDTIMDDYLKTNQINLPKAQKLKAQLEPIRGEAFAEGVYQAFIADRSYLEAAWDAMGNHFFEELGITNEDIAGFRSSVLL